MSEHAFTIANPETKPFREAAAQNRFLVPRCRSCGKHHWYPRAVCPYCMAVDVEWTEASGEGEIYSFSVMRAAKPPYCIAYVTLAEGPRMMTRIVNGDFDAIRIGRKVKVAFETGDDGFVAPVFELA